MNALPGRWAAHMPGGLNALNTDWLPEEFENGYPVIWPSDLDDIHTLAPFRSTPSPGVALHFFIDDYRFECVWNSPEKYVNQFMAFDAVLSPDFSQFTDWPDPVNRWNHYRKMWLSAYLQRAGVNIIPVGNWSTPGSFDYCFSGIPKHSPVAVCTMGASKSPDRYRAGFNEMRRILSPSTILIAENSVIDGCAGNVYKYEFKTRRYTMEGN